MSATTAAALPGVGYLFQWPLFFAVALLGLLLLREKIPIPAGIFTAAAAVLCAPAILLGADTFSLGAEALTLSFAWAFVPLIALLLAISWPFFDLLLDRGGKLIPLLAAAGFAVLVAGGTLTSGFSASRPLPETIAYGLDADRDRAFWITCPDQPLAWSAQFFAHNSSVGPLPDFSPLTEGCFNQSAGFRHAPAPAVPLPAPLLILRSEVSSPGGRDLTLLLRSPRGASEATLYIERLPGMGDISIDGKRIVEVPIEKMKPLYRMIMRQLDYRRWFMIDFSALPADGVTVLMSAVPDRTPIVKVVDVSDFLPDEALRGFTSRPASSMPGQALLLPNGTMVAKEYRFPPSPGRRAGP